MNGVYMIKLSLKKTLKDQVWGAPGLVDILRCQEGDVPRMNMDARHPFPLYLERYMFSISCSELYTLQ